MEDCFHNVTDMIYRKNDWIGDYQVSFPLNKGIYAESYRVKDKTDRLRFLKLISYDQLIPSQFDLDGEIREVRLTKSINHRNFTKFIDSQDIIINEKKYCCLVTEFVSCETLDRYVKYREFNEYDLKKIIVTILRALEYLHDREIPIVHNDVTARNILINLTGDYSDLKLIDFGNTCFQGDLAPIRNHIRENEVFYIAPERLPEGNRIPEGDVRGDIFSVGVIMYNLLFKAQPWYVDLKYVPVEFWISSIEEARRQKLLLPEFSKFNKGGQLINIMLKALDLNPDNRFASARDFIDAVEGTDMVSIYDSKVRFEFSNAPVHTAPKNRKFGKGFAEVAGMEDIKQMIQSDVIDILNDREGAKSLGLSIPNGILFYGPPGCGKTYFAEKLAEEMKCNYLYVKCSDVASPYIHGGQEKIAAIFSEARKNVPSVIFLDEIDAILKDRRKHDNVSQAGEVNEFLVQMNNCGKDGILVIAATNQPMEIDEAALRAGRLELKYYIPLPGIETRRQLFEIGLHDRRHAELISYEMLADATEGYSCADIRLLIDTAARIAFRSKVSEITMEHLIEACNNMQPSLSSSSLKKYQAMKDAFEGNNSKHPRVGFK